MAWFNSPQLIQSSSQDNILRLAQITDCHLFADGTLYDGVDTFVNLQRTLLFLAGQSLDGVIATGDLTQDHTQTSFERFALCYREHLANVPLFWLPGNHDEIEQLELVFNAKPFNDAKHLCFVDWHIVLLNSKGPTPSGLISPEHFADMDKLLRTIPSNHKVLCFCHHHPVPVNGYIDKHGLINGEDLVAQLLDFPQVRALAYGHVHQFRHQMLSRSGGQMPLDLYATAATSIQFKVNSMVRGSVDLGPAYRLFELRAFGDLLSKEIYLDKQV